MKHLDVPMVAFAAIVTALHLLVYAMTTGSPLASSPPAWEGFWDQSQYVTERGSVCQRQPCLE